DRILEVDRLAVELDTGELLDALDDVGDADGAVELALVAGLGGDDDTSADQLGGDPLGLLLGLALGLLTGAAQGLGGADGSFGGLDGLLLRQQEVAGVAVGHVDDVTLLAERRNVGSEYQLHFVAT